MLALEERTNVLGIPADRTVAVVDVEDDDGDAKAAIDPQLSEG
jgi:hypothetical protein